MNRKRITYDRKVVGENIKKARIKKGITQEELAKSIDRAMKYISDIERGECGMSIETLLLIAEKLDVSLDYIMYEKNGWVPCAKELPPQPKSNPEFQGKALELYLVSMAFSKYPWRVFWNGEFFSDGFSKVYPIAWQPMPKGYEV